MDWLQHFVIPCIFHSPKTLDHIFCLQVLSSPIPTFSCDLASYFTEKIGLKKKSSRITYLFMSGSIYSVFLLVIISVVLFKSCLLHSCMVYISSHLFRGMDTAIVPSLVCIISFFSPLDHSQKHKFAVIFPILKGKKSFSRTIFLLPFQQNYLTGSLYLHSPFSPFPFFLKLHSDHCSYCTIKTTLV